MSIRRFALAGALAVMGAALPAAQAAEPVIQPGGSLGGYCTLNFVFDGQGKHKGDVFIGTAAHCVEEVGEEVKLGSGEAFGKVALIGESGHRTKDYAFIEIYPEYHANVDPSLAGHPSFPTGVTKPEETATGDMIQPSGYGVGFSLNPATREGRKGMLVDDDDENYVLDGLIVNGDSGGPLVHEKTGKALGIVSQYCFDCPATDTGPTVQGIIAKAKKAGFKLKLRTVSD